MGAGVHSWPPARPRRCEPNPDRVTSDLSPQPAAATPPTPNWARKDLIAIGIGLVLLALWEASGLDLPLIHWYGDAKGFAWRDHWLTSQLLHDGTRKLGWALFAVLFVSVWRPIGFLRRLSRRERIWWVLTTVLCIALVPLLKRASATSCPWSLLEFGGEAGHYVPHWLLGVRDGGPGGCFPSGHASTAFALLPAWFVLRDAVPKVARIVLACVLVAGFVLAWVQMMRGAHYLSHSMWTAWICFTLGALSWHVGRA